MKKFVFLSILFLSLLFITGCEKDEVELSPKITVKANPQEPEFDGSSIVSWEIKNLGNVLSVSVFIGNEDVSGEYSGNIRLENITEPITVRVVCATQDRDIEESIQIVPKDPVIIPPDAPTITVNADPPTLPVGGGTTTLSWITQNADTVLVNDVPYGPSESIDVNLVKDSTFIFLAKGPGGQTTATISVAVETPPPPMTPLELLRNGKWYRHESYMITGQIKDTLFFAKCRYDDYYLYKENNEQEYAWVGLMCEGQTEPIYHYFQYLLVGDYIYGLGEDPRHVLILNDTVMVYHYGGPNGSTIENLFKHYPLPID
jgi:hypothetical protein